MVCCSLLAHTETTVERCVWYSTAPVRFRCQSQGPWFAPWSHDLRLGPFSGLTTTGKPYFFTTSWTWELTAVWFRVATAGRDVNPVTPTNLQNQRSYLSSCGSDLSPSNLRGRGREREKQTKNIASNSKCPSTTRFVSICLGAQGLVPRSHSLKHTSPWRDSRGSGRHDVAPGRGDTTNKACKHRAATNISIKHSENHFALPKVVQNTQKPGSWTCICRKRNIIMVQCPFDVESISLRIPPPVDLMKKTALEQPSGQGTLATWADRAQVALQTCNTRRNKHIGHRSLHPTCFLISPALATANFLRVILSLWLGPHPIHAAASCLLLFVVGGSERAKGDTCCECKSHNVRVGGSVPALYRKKSVNDSRCYTVVL